MPSKLGINLDFNNPSGRPAPGALEIFGWARLVARPDAGFSGYVSGLRRVGIRTIVILGRESFPAGDLGNQLAAQLFADQARTYAEQVQPDCWQVGNEPDQISPSSWTVPPQQY